MINFYLRPIIPLLLSLVAGITLGSASPGYSLWAGGMIIICTGLILIHIIWKQAVWLAPFLLFVAVGYLSIQPWVFPRFPSNHIVHYLDGNRWDIVGVIDKHPLDYGTRQKVVLSVETLGEGQDSFAATGKMGVTISGVGPQLDRGDRIFLRSRIRSIRNFNNPGGFDYREYMAFQGVWGSAYCQGNKLTILKKNSKITFIETINHTRKAIIDLIEGSGHGTQIGLLKALMVGDRTAVSQKTREAFNRAGVGHLLAISGLHVGIVASVAFVFFQWLLAAIKPLLWKAWTRKGAALLSLLPVFFYGLVSGFSPSTQRAVIMISVFLMTFQFEREHDLMNSLALAALVILVIYPSSLFSISFQLSFSAVLAIIYGFSRFQSLQRRNENEPAALVKAKRRLTTFFWVSVFAIGGTAPLVMFYFNQISIVGILANFVIVPCVGFMVIPLGLIAIVLSPLCPVWASWCFKACAAVLSLTLKMVNFWAEFPFAAVKTITPTVFEIACYYLLAWALLSLTKDDQNPSVKQIGDLQITPSHPETTACRNFSAGSTFPPGSFAKTIVAAVLIRLKWGQKVMSRRKFAGLVAIAVILGLTGDVSYWLYHRFWHGDLRVTIIDVGQGSAALLELPRGYNMLIDGGGFSDNSVFDVGARVVAPLLWRKKIRTVNTIVLSHANSDHLNGLIYIAEHFNVQTIWTNNEGNTTIGYRKLTEIVAGRKIQVPEFRNLPRKQTINGVDLSIIYPQKKFLDKKVIENWRTINNNSLVIRISFGSMAFLFPGDIMAEAERELVQITENDITSAVLLAPHHGSRSSSTNPFLDKVDPDVVVISSGWKNRARFPHAQVLQSYRDRGLRIFRTDINGAITFITDGQQLLIKPFFSWSQTS